MAPMTESGVQVWTLPIDGAAHRVEVRGGALRRYTQWFVDDVQVAAKGSIEGKLRLTSEEHGDLVVRYSALGAPLSATVAGVDLVPVPGSAAERHEQRVRANPNRYAATQTAGGVARVVVPIVLTVLLARLAFSIDWPDWNLPDLPDLPDVPWPDLPDIPVPDVTLPGWLRWILENAHCVIPVLVAFALARAEIRRRRTQDELRAARAEERHEER
jgi:hypothetical protein